MSLPESGPIVRLISISKSYGSARVVDDVSFELAKGEKLVIIGASGSGKTTVLRCLIGLTEIDSGTIEIDGQTILDRRNGSRQPVSKAADRLRRDKLGMVFQSFNLFPHRTVLQNVIEAPIHVRKVPREEAVARADLLLDRVGLRNRRDYYPAQLSGGMQQRVAIARALAMQPELILFDEVTSALDPELTGEVLAVMRDLASEGQAMIIVTHEMGFAREVADRIMFMDDGKVIEDGTPDAVLLHPQHQRTRQFLGKVLHMHMAGLDNMPASGEA